VKIIALGYIIMRRLRGRQNFSCGCGIDISEMVCAASVHYGYPQIGSCPVRLGVPIDVVGTEELATGP